MMMQKGILIEDIEFIFYNLKGLIIPYGGI